MIKNLIIVLAFLIISFTSCKKEENSILIDGTTKNFDGTRVNTSMKNIIPRPILAIPQRNPFKLTSNTKIVFLSKEDLADTEKSLKWIESFCSTLNRITGYDLKISCQKENLSSPYICFNVDKVALPEESYGILISERGIEVSVQSWKGVMYAIQSLSFLIPIDEGRVKKKCDYYEIESGLIIDHPYYSYRGLMLDIARRFIPLDEIKKIISLMSIFKMNTLHLHLTDDQGWRIEIKSLPKLTEIGAQREVGGTSSGYLTQKEYLELQEYAAIRGITVIPEIDIPGHTHAAIASYPLLGIEKDPKNLYTGIGVGFSAIDVKNNYSLSFFKKVIEEIAAITKGNIIHVGGDECPRRFVSDKDYGTFIREIEQAVSRCGKTMMGWEEVRSSIKENTSIVQIWRDLGALSDLKDKKNRIVFSDAKSFYLDMQYVKGDFGNNWSSPVELDAAYNVNPAQSFPRERILGVESALWTEIISDKKKLYHMLFPRLLCHAEVGWTEQQHRNWDDFKLRLAYNYERLSTILPNFYKSPLIDWVEVMETKEPSHKRKDSDEGYHSR